MWNQTPVMEAPPAHEMLSLEYLLLGDLRELLNEPPTRETRKYLEGVLDMLLRLLPSQFAMEEHGGYLREVTDEFPTWYDKVEALRDEHRALFEELMNLRSDLASQRDFRESSVRIRQRIADWIDHLTNHEHAERDLVQMASTLDVGEGE